MHYKKKSIKVIRKMRRKTYCIHIGLKIGAVACSGILLFVEGLAIEIAVERYLSCSF